jgi:hypothetical protein
MALLSLFRRVEERPALMQKPCMPSVLTVKVREVVVQPSAPKEDTAQKIFGFTPLLIR